MFKNNTQNPGRVTRHGHGILILLIHIVKNTMIRPTTSGMSTARFSCLQYYWVFISSHILFGIRLKKIIILH